MGQTTNTTTVVCPFFQQSARFHDLRHSAATIMLGMGVRPKVVQEILGHSQIGMTMDTYSHVLPSMQQEAMSKLDDLFWGNKQNRVDENHDIGDDEYASRVSSHLY